MLGRPWNLLSAIIPETLRSLVVDGIKSVWRRIRGDLRVHDDEQLAQIPHAGAVAQSRSHKRTVGHSGGIGLRILSFFVSRRDTRSSFELFSAQASSSFEANAQNEEVSIQTDAGRVCLEELEMGDIRIGAWTQEGDRRLGPEDEGREAPSDDESR